MLDLTALRAPSPDNPLIGQLLSETQGHVLEKHRREHVWSLLFRFNKSAGTQIKRAIAQMPCCLPSVRDLLSAKCTPNGHAGRHNAPSTGDTVFCFFGIAASGLSKLGAQPVRFSPEFREGFSQRFGKRMLQSKKAWCSEWTTGYDAILVCAGDDPRDLALIQSDMKAHFHCMATIHVEKGFVKRGHPVNGRKGPSLEHFGFADGISQPMFLEDKRNAPNSSWTSGYDPRAPLCQILIPDPLAPCQSDSFGSYMAYLKIEQHVDRFDTFVSQLAKTLPTPSGSSGCPGKLAAARLVGRHVDGRPLVGGDGNLNDFDRTTDASGATWPMQSHISKMNARDGINSSPILRRGITFDEHGKKGILFQSFQSDLEFQFEMQLRNWANNPNHPVAGTGVDFMLSDPVGTASASAAQRPPTCPKSLTTLLGGEYFYFPSIPGIRNAGAWV